MSNRYEPVTNPLLDDDSKDHYRSGNQDKQANAKSVKTTAAAIGIFQLILFILFAATSAQWEISENQTAFSTYYSLFLGVEIMMFIGFGYLMTFLKEYGIGAIGLTMMITVIGFQWALFTETFWKQVYDGETRDYSFSIVSLIESLYAVAAVLISFGGVIGKLSPLQLFIMTIVELVFYSLNNQVFLVGGLKLVDVGGTVIIHMFGAYFGLAVAFVIGNERKETGAQGYVPDMFAFIGTLFLWIYWPSFVCGALEETGGVEQQRAIFATILSLAASSTVAFSLSLWLSEDGTFRPVDIQNATLAGGVSIGAVANLNMPPLIACLIGMIAGAVSTVGFAKLQPLLEEKLGLYDTCGIHNLHGMPSIIGGFFSVVLAAWEQSKGHAKEIYVEHDDQWEYQLFGMAITLGFAIFTGTITGYGLKSLGAKGSAPYFNDQDSWHAD